MSESTIVMPQLEGATQSITDLAHDVDVTFPIRFRTKPSHWFGTGRGRGIERVGEFDFDDGSTLVVRTKHDKWDPYVVSCARIERYTAIHSEGETESALFKYSDAGQSKVFGVDDSYLGRSIGVASLYWAYHNHFIDILAHPPETVRNLVQSSKTMNELNPHLFRGWFAETDEVEVENRHDLTMEHEISYSGSSLYIHRVSEDTPIHTESRKVHKALDELIPDQDGLMRNQSGGSTLGSAGWQEHVDTKLRSQETGEYELRTYSRDDVPGVVVVSSSRLTTEQMKERISRL